MNTQNSILPVRQDILAVAREQVLDRGEALTQAQIPRSCGLPDERLTELLALAHEVRMRWCGPEVEVEGIVVAQDRRLPGGLPLLLPVRPVRLPGPRRSGWTSRRWSRRRRQTAATGATEFCIVAAVRGPDARLMKQMREGVAAIQDAVDIQVAASLGMLTQEQVDELADMGVHRYNHNLETARSYFPNVVTTHTWEERWETLRDGPRRRHGGLLRRHRRHGRDRGAAGRVRRPARRAGPARGAAELPQPAARAPRSATCR